MQDQVNPLETPAPRAAILHHVAAVMLTLGFIAVGNLRLNDCDLFNPDSPRYLIYAQSLAETGEYRAIDTPGAPLYTWRPPGLPLLLAPVLSFYPYSVVAAKSVVLITGALLLLAVHLLASQVGGRWSGLLMLCAVGISPIWLSLATEVLSEIPYTLGVLAVLCGLRGVGSSSLLIRRLAFGLVLISLSMTPVVRTVGVALVVAVGLWSLTSRRRWMLLIPVVFAVASLGWLFWRSRLASGGNYAGSLAHSIQERGLPAVIGESLRTLSFYATAFPGVLFPGLTSEQPFYAPMVVGSLPSLDFASLTAGLAVLVAGLGLIGLWRERHHGGWVGLMYIVLYAGCLAIWPWRHERFVWPLVPVLWAFAPAGWNFAVSRSRALRVVATPVVVSGLIAMGIWQSLSCAALVSTNQRFIAHRDSFYRDEAPGFYFSDWRQAGRWLKENTNPQDRVLTWQGAVGGTAHRFQRRIQFEVLNPEKIRQQIASFPAKYLVITTAQCGLGFNWRQVFADPSYHLRLVYHERDVAILAVEPNQDGGISRTAYQELLKTRQSALEEVLSHHSDRNDLLARQADLWQEQGQNEKAIALLEQLMQRGMVTVRVCSSLGWLYFAEGRFDQAAGLLDLAQGLPNAEPVAESLRDGALRARDRLAHPADNSTELAVARSLRMVAAQAASLDFPAAESELDRILPSAPQNPDLNYWRGYLHHLFEEYDNAEARYVRAVKFGSNDAREKLLLLRMQRAIALPTSSIVTIDGASHPVDPGAWESHVRLARLYDEHGWSGRAMVALDTARKRFGDIPEILLPLAELELRFARPEVALGHFKRVCESWPHDKGARQGAAAAEAALRKPAF